MNKQTTRMMLMIAALVSLPALAAEPPPPAPPTLVKPTPEQVAWQDLELGMFYHFDIITFTDLNEGAWQGAGHLDPLCRPQAHRTVRRRGGQQGPPARDPGHRQAAAPDLGGLSCDTPANCGPATPTTWIPEPMMQTRA